MGHQGGFCVLEDWQARELLLKLNKSLSVRRIARMLGASKSSVHRWLKGERIPPKYSSKLCELFPEEDLLAILKSDQLLLKYGVMSEDGRINKSLVLALIDAIMRNELLKEEVLSYVLKYYKTELAEKLGEIIPKIELRWSQDLEKWLLKQEGRPGKPISPRTLIDYRRIWDKCLEGKVLGWHLIKQLTGRQMECKDGRYHPTGWARQIVRHYIKYLYSKGARGLDWDTYTRLMMAIPSRGYGKKVSQKPVPAERVSTTLEFLKTNNEKVYLVYSLMLFSGVRFEHVLHALNNWNPNEELHVEYLDSDVKRLTCFENKGFCRYYLGLEEGQKPEAFMYFPLSFLELIEKHKNEIPRRDTITKYAKDKGILQPKYARVFAIRQIRRFFRRKGLSDVGKFILGKFSELSVTEAHYLNLLEEADEAYPELMQYITKNLGLSMNANMMINAVDE